MNPTPHDPSFDDAARAGAVLAGKYRVERVIGGGGMGVVVAARHLQLDEPVAIKLLRPEVAQRADVIERFLREGRAAARIRSEHVARVIDVGTLESGAPYMVMEYLDGKDLSKLLRERGRLPFDEAVDWVLQACEAIAEAHVAGIVHRDLKPANLFLTSRADGSPCVKVLDFGISKLASLPGRGAERAMTTPSTFLGSPLYMSPEQIRSAHDVDARADIWALGVVLFELCAGAPPFSAPTLPELAAAIIGARPASLRALRPDVPEELERVVLRCLDKDPAGRYADVAELSAALRRLAPTRAGVIQGARPSAPPTAYAAPAGAHGALRTGGIAGIIGLVVGVGATVAIVLAALPRVPPPASTQRRPAASASTSAEYVAHAPPAPRHAEISGRVVIRRGSQITIAWLPEAGFALPVAGLRGVLYGKSTERGSSAFVPAADVIVKASPGAEAGTELVITAEKKDPGRDKKADPLARNAIVKLRWEW